jgi:hypothetical protein
MTPQVSRFAKIARWANYGMVALILLLGAIWYFHA